MQVWLWKINSAFLNSPRDSYENMAKVFTCLCVISYFKNQVLLDMYKLPILTCLFFPPPIFEWYSKPTILDWVLHMGIFIVTSQANMTSFFETEKYALTNMYQFIIQGRQHVWTIFTYVSILAPVWG